MLAFRLLGPVGVWADGRAVGLGPAESAKARCVLAVLLRTPGALVTTDALIERVWGERPPGAAVRYKYVGWLRSALAPYGVALAHRDEGYVLGVDADQVDLHRFRRLVALAQQASGAGDPDRAALLLDEGLDLWRGPALAGLPGAWVEMFRDQLGRERRDARVQWARCVLAAGRAAEALRRLTEWETEHPLDEEIIGLRMTALSQLGQRAQALTCYERARLRLREALDSAPGPELRAVYVRVLGAEPAVDRTVPFRGLRVTPRQLPSVTRHFIGRRAELDLLGALLDGRGWGIGGGAGASVAGGPGGAAGTSGSAGRAEAERVGGAGRAGGGGAEAGRGEGVAEGSGGVGGGEAQWGGGVEGAGQAGHAEIPGSAVLITIAGSAGIGKTALAVHWAHRAADRFPDGQLFVDLRGFAPGGRPMAAGDAVRGFLDALEVDPQRIPTDPQAQAALYRSALAGRRMLVVLDNARDADQIRPLLPGTSTCLVLVTSRDLLTGLVATEGAHPLALDLLAADEAYDLLTRLLGARRVAQEPAAVDELIVLCARQPLALSIAAARAATRPVRPLAALTAELGDARGRLDVLRGGDTATDLRAVFSWSYRTLSAPAARMFRLLGLHPGPDIGLPAAASLAGIPPQETATVLDELTRAHLLAEPAAGRFAVHDLLRAYAAEQARAHDSDTERHAAVHRVLDHYLHTAHPAAHRLRLPRPPITLTPPQDGVRPEELADPAQALAWYEAEHAVLMAALALAASAGFDTHAWQLPWTLANFLNRRGHWHDWEVAQRTALAAVRRLGDPPEQARAHFGLGLALLRSGQHTEAETQLRLSLDLHLRLADRTGQAHAHSGLARIYGETGRYVDALSHAERSLRLFEQAGRRAGWARALTTIGRLHALLGDYVSALAYGERSVIAHRELGDDCGQAEAWHTLGRTHHHLAEYDQARACYQRARLLYRELGDRYAEAEVLVHLGDLDLATGAPGPAREAWRQALAVFDDLRHPEAADVRARLES